MSTLYTSLQDMSAKADQIRRTEGESAAQRYMKNQSNTATIVCLGASKGAALGTLICPGIGTVVGVIAGLFWGASLTSED